jgi:hypothetical protein
MRFLTSVFFLKTISSGPLIHGLKPFQIWLRCGRHSSLIDIAATDTAVSMTPLLLTSRIQLCKLCSKAHKHSGVNDIAVLMWHCCVWWPRIQEALAAFKGYIFFKYSMCKLYYPIAITITQKYTSRGYLRIGDFIVFVSSRIWSHIQKGFNLCIRGQEEVFDEKNQRWKILWHGRFNQLQFCKHIFCIKAIHLVDLMQF